MSTIVIPARLAHRPTQGGRVIPWIQVVLADGTADFRSVHETKRLEALRRRLCGVCGEPHAYYLVFLVEGEKEVRRRHFGEPPLHPECAEYTVRACPMVAGDLERHPARPTRSQGPRGEKCSTPGCDCAGWVSHDRRATRDRPRAPWWWYRTRTYTIRTDRRGRIVACAAPAVELRELG